MFINVFYIEATVKDWC